ncbi:MAG: ANTAR domain-containing protein [Gracilibacteraceae bacterium]|jgi:response regulator NasT|nr:ANTAR domain-containing protein [Gracilibacteraceae bacterium]
MDYALVASGSEKPRGFLLQTLKETIYGQVAFTRAGSEARRFLRTNDYDLVVINTPLTDEFGHELALTALENTSAGVILIVKSEIAEEVELRFADYGVFVLAKPLNRQIFYQSLKLMAASRRRLVSLKKQNSELRHKIEELRLVDRAKCALIQYLNMTEAQAHRYIEKQAMDMRTAKTEIAQSILRNYEA